jgi:aquaporin NIP
MCMLKLTQKSVAEFIGTFVMVFAGCGSIMVAERFSITPGATPALVFGLSVAAMIYALGHISGAHFNPAVTFAFAIARHFPWREVIAYWIAQFLGALLALTLLFWLLPQGQLYGAVTTTLPAIKAIGWEALLTFILMFVITAVATDTRAVGTMAGAAIGATVMLCALFGGPVTGAAMNPARALAPALFQGTFNSLWIYFAGPFLGASLAAVLYEWIRCEPDKKSSKGCC